jgi:nucleotide-binding universal stress UspA family protein
VLELARANDAEIVLLRVPVYAYAREGYNTYALSQGYGPVPLKDDREGALKECKRYLNKLRSDLIRLGVRVAVVTPEGEAAPRIIDYAHRPDVDLIAMATRIPTGFHRMLFGSTVDEVMREAGKPVLVISP